MKSTNAEVRVKAMDALDALCARGMLYEFVTGWDKIDAVLISEKTGRQFGVARIFSAMGNYGSKPVVELPKEDIDFMYEMNAFLGKNAAAAVLVRFRDKLMYWKIDRVLNSDQKMLRGKPFNFYKLPINLLKNV